MGSHKALEPGVTPSEAWSIRSYFYKKAFNLQRKKFTEIQIFHHLHDIESPNKKSSKNLSSIGEGPGVYT